MQKDCFLSDYLNYLKIIMKYLTNDAKMYSAHPSFKAKDKYIINNNTSNQETNK